MLRVVSVRDAKTHFSRLLDQVRAGAEVVIAKNGEPYARLVPLSPRTTTRTLGFLGGLEDLQRNALMEPLPASEIAEFDELV